MTKLSTQHEVELEEHGFVVIPGVLSPEKLNEARLALDRAVEEMRLKGEATFNDKIDYTDANIRVYHLAERDPIFRELLVRPEAQQFVEHLLGPDAIVAEFSANIALPGSKSMKVHSDQALVEPPPWNKSNALNIIWCLDDLHADNGATRYLPRSHTFRSFEELPENVDSQMVAFRAPAGSIVAMEGRLWHTSGANVTANEQRRLMFAYYLSSSVRPAVEWETLIKPDAPA